MSVSTANNRPLVLVPDAPDGLEREEQLTANYMHTKRAVFAQRPKGRFGPAEARWFHVSCYAQQIAYCKPVRFGDHMRSEHTQCAGCKRPINDDPS